MKTEERAYDFLRMIEEKRVGFKMDEVMEGTHRLKDGPLARVALPMSFRASWGSKNLGKFLFDFFRGRPAACELSGTANIEGLCQNAEVKGKLEFRYLVDATLRYEFEFYADGKPHLFVGDKENIRPWNLRRTHTTCHGIILDQSTHMIISISVVYFDPRTLPRFLASLRFG